RDAGSGVQARFRSGGMDRQGRNRQRGRRFLQERVRYMVAYHVGPSASHPVAIDQCRRTTARSLFRAWMSLADRSHDRSKMFDDRRFVVLSPHQLQTVAPQIVPDSFQPQAARDFLRGNGRNETYAHSDRGKAENKMAGALLYNAWHEAFGRAGLKECIKALRIE